MLYNLQGTAITDIWNLQLYEVVKKNQLSPMGPGNRGKIRYDAVALHCMNISKASTYVVFSSFILFVFFLGYNLTFAGKAMLYKIPTLVISSSIACPLCVVGNQMTGEGILYPLLFFLSFMQLVMYKAAGQIYLTLMEKNIKAKKKKEGIMTVVQLHLPSSS